VKASLNTKVLKTYVLILLAVLVLVGTIFTSLFSLNYSHKILEEEILPKKELFKDYKAKINELALLVEQSESFFAKNDFERINRFQGLIDVELPQLNQKTYVTSESLITKIDFYKTNKQIIYFGEEIVRISSKVLLNRAISPSQYLMVKDYISRIKNLLDYQVINITKQEKTSFKQQEQNALIAAIVGGIFSLFSVGLIVYAIKIQQKSVVRPVLELSQKLYDFSEKNYGEQFSFGDSKEFQMLSEAVSKMSKSLKENFDDIETKNKNLSAASDKLQKSNDHLEEFAYVASHDLKTPVRGVKNLAMFMMEDYEDKLDKEGKDMLKKLGENAEKINNLIDDLLSYSKASKTDLEKNNINLNRTIKDVIQYLDLDQERSIKINIQDLPTLLGDEAKIKSVFTNLFTNAVKYNESEIKEISIWFENGKLYFKDNGIGIEERDYDKVFAFFRRAHVGKYEGTGAGMAIVKKILDRHGASISIDSKVGVGTTFIIDCSKCLV